MIAQMKHFFLSKDSIECAMYINENFDENGDDFAHIWIEKVTA